jgi:hypothetical protein
METGSPKLDFQWADFHRNNVLDNVFIGTPLYKML